MELTNTHQIETWRQKLNAEAKVAKGKNMADIERLKELLEGKNTYLHHYKGDTKKNVEHEEEKTKTNFAFD